MKAVFNWSGGKDSAFCLNKCLIEDSFKIKCLLTTMNSAKKRISMHGVREVLLEMQSQAIGIPLKKVYLPEDIGMQNYDEIMSNTLGSLMDQGIKSSIFGDIFLEDLRTYRIEKLKEIGMTASFPIWKISTQTLVKDFIDQGFKAVVVSIQSNKLDKNFCGRIIDDSFLNDLPKEVDPCGENGEFHSFVFDAPFFKRKIDFKIGDVVYKEYKLKNNNDDCFKQAETTSGYWYIDLEPRN